jgi:hypothetical protein
MQDRSNIGCDHVARGVPERATQIERRALFRVVQEQAGTKLRALRGVMA